MVERSGLIIVAFVFAIVSLVILFALFVILMIVLYLPKKSNHFLAYPFKTKVKPGDIILRKIMGRLTGFYHSGVVSNDMKFIYHRSFLRFEKASWKKFLGRENEFYVLHFPLNYYQSLDKSIEALEGLVEKEKHSIFPLYDFNLVKKNCEAKIIPLRLLKEYSDAFIYNSVQIHHIACKNGTPRHYKCNRNDLVYFLTVHDRREIKHLLYSSISQDFIINMNLCINCDKDFRFFHLFVRRFCYHDLIEIC